MGVRCLMETMVAFEWRRKAIGEPGSVPQYCPCCNAKMSERGWIRFGNKTRCLKCEMVFDNG